VPVRLRAALKHAELLSRHPIDATSDHLRLLADAGLATVEIVVLSQIIAFVSFQVRVITALKLLGGANGPLNNVPAGAPAVAASGTLPPATIVRPGPVNSPPVFTRAQLEWTPWLVPLDMADASPKQIAALEGRRGNSPYFRLLGLDADVLTERTATDLGIFYTHGGAPRAERELAAAATSRLNGCIYCASVHARTAAQLSKREDDVDRLLDKGVGPGVDLELDERWSAVVDFAVELARTPSSATTAQIERLRAVGLSELEILDIAQAASFFSWANRLMLTLGEPYAPES
jgi:alkylhydroperoxidase domain protein